MIYQQRNIVVYVILSIVTCFLFSFYWIYQIGNDLYKLNNLPSNAGIDLVLSIVTCGIYFIYLQYKWGKLIDSARRRYDLDPRDDAMLFVLLAVFNMFTGFLVLVNYCIIQAQLNEELIPAAESVPRAMIENDRSN